LQTPSGIWKRDGKRQQREGFAFIKTRLMVDDTGRGLNSKNSKGGKNHIDELAVPSRACENRHGLREGKKGSQKGPCREVYKKNTI